MNICQRIMFRMYSVVNINVHTRYMETLHPAKVIFVKTHQTDSLDRPCEDQHGESHLEGMKALAHMQEITIGHL